MSLRAPSRRLESMPDDRLVQMVRDGAHPRAFEVLVQRYSQELTRYCRRMGLSDSRSEDVLQHSFLRAWMALEAGTEVRDLRPWLYRIVHNTAVNAMRSSPDILSPLDEAESIDASSAGGSDFERRLAVRSALSSVAALPAMQRDAIVMSAIDGRSHEEVATALGVTDGAVRGLLYRARATLRAAAAAFTPAPLIGWAGTRLAPATDRVVALTAQGGSAELGGTLIKGAAVAVTAAVLVAGATQVPFHSGHAQHRAPSADAAITATARTGGGSAAAPVRTGTSTTTTTAPALSQTPLQAAGGTGTGTVVHVGAGVRKPTRTISGHPQQEGTQPAAPPLTAAASPSPGASHAAGAGSGGASEPVKAPGSTGSEAPSGKPGSGGEGTPAPEGTNTEKEREAKETEAEKARELKEEEAEKAREAKEREAELAREAKEREAEAAHKGN